jgi:hypothetical protein
MKNEIMNLTVKVSFLENKKQTRDLEGDIADLSSTTSKEPYSDHSETDIESAVTQAVIDDLEEDSEIFQCYGCDFKTKKKTVLKIQYMITLFLKFSKEASASKLSTTE